MMKSQVYKHVCLQAKSPYCRRIVRDKGPVLGTECCAQLHQPVQASREGV